MITRGEYVAVPLTESTGSSAPRLDHGGPSGGNWDARSSSRRWIARVQDRGPRLDRIIKVVSSSSGRLRLLSLLCAVSVLLLFAISHLIVPCHWRNHVLCSKSRKGRELVIVSDQQRMDGVVFWKDEKSGYWVPPKVEKGQTRESPRANAALIVLVRSSELEAMRYSMEQVEARFNHKFHYPWIFFNEVPFSEEFKKGVQAMTKAPCSFEVIPAEHWSLPDWVDRGALEENLRKSEAMLMNYGGLESYRHMCRYNSGFFYRQPALASFDWYWRVEPGIDLYCDIDYDPFHFMKANGKVYGFTITVKEDEITIPTLWKAASEWAKQHPEWIRKDGAMDWIVNDGGGLDGDYNLCHFWSNFEIADLNWYRTKEYQSFFDFLDQKGGFFLERWGDAPIHSIAAAFLLPISSIHQFDSIGYKHFPYTHCPENRAKYHDSGKCQCDPAASFDRVWKSCTARWWDLTGMPDDWHRTTPAPGLTLIEDQI